MAVLFSESIGRTRVREIQECVVDNMGTFVSNEMIDQLMIVIAQQIAKGQSPEISHIDQETAAYVFNCLIVPDFIEQWRAWLETEVSELLATKATIAEAGIDQIRTITGSQVRGKSAGYIMSFENDRYLVLVTPTKKPIDVYPIK